MPTVFVKPGRDKPVRQRHPWIYSGAIRGTRGDPNPGDVVDVCSGNDASRVLAQGYYNPRSQIAVRLLTWDLRETVDAGFWRDRLSAAIARRRSLQESGCTNAYRLVHAESDRLPGLVVDRYGDWLVVQILALGLEPWRDTLVEYLQELLRPAGIWERSDVDVRRLEGLDARTGRLAGKEPPARIEILEDGLRFAVDLRHGHKTGFYLDQRVNRRRAAAYAQGADLLNAFAYTGAFGVYAAHHPAAGGGARRVVHLDSSADSLDVARENVALNRGTRGSCAHEYVEADAFEALRALRDAGEQFDLVILDPPKFAHSQRQVHAATRGYKDINMLGMALTKPGGVLITFSCSGAVSEDLFQKVLFGASIDVGRQVRVVERLAQGPDHPLLLTFPEGAYLKGFVCRVE